MNEKPELKVDWCSHKAAKFACENWHYSKCMPVGKIVKVGAWEDNKYIGCVLFSRGSNVNIGKPFNLGQDECCELTRIALSKHKTFVSEIMVKAFKFLKLKNPKIRLIISYADADQNHEGKIYQATNWIYTGLLNVGTRGAFIIHGKKVHNKSVHSKGVIQSLVEVRKHLDPNATEFITKGKHKYLMPLDKKMRRQILKLSKPYPKKTCSEGVTGSTSGFQSEGIGSSPIQSL